MNLPFKKKQPQFTRRQLQTARPTRNPVIEWEADDEGKVLLRVPRKSRGFWAWIGGWMKVPDIHRVELENIAATVWKMCDGKTTVEGIMKELCQTYKMNRAEAEVSLHAFLQTLSQRGYIAVIVSKKS